MQENIPAEMEYFPSGMQGLQDFNIDKRGHGTVFVLCTLLVFLIITQFENTLKFLIIKPFWIMFGVFVGESRNAAMRPSQDSAQIVLNMDVRTLQTQSMLMWNRQFVETIAF